MEALKVSVIQIHEKSHPAAAAAHLPVAKQYQLVVDMDRIV